MIQAEQLLFCPAASLPSDKLDRNIPCLSKKQQIKKKIGIIMRIFARAYSLEAGVMQAGLISVNYIIICRTIFLLRFLPNLCLVFH
jgi:hypothetical protein